MPSLLEETGAGTVPRHETQAWEFLQAHPEFDGRGVVVAILDTGVDPGAAGLQVCPDGRPKVIDIIDCTGGGDVDMSTVIKGEDVVVDGGVPTIPGLSGRRLKLNPAWQNPSGEWRVGIKSAMELYNDRGLADRMKKELKKGWDVAQKAAEASVQKQLAEWRKKHGGDGTKASGEVGQQLQDLEDLLAQLSQCNKDHEEPGIILDCVVWSDGAEPPNFFAAVDTSETGDLSGAEAMTDFRKQRQFRPLSDKCRLNYGVNILENGAVLSILTDSGAHGTHVAGIVAAHHPVKDGDSADRDDKEKGARDGVAPGAQIVSLVIGDVRLGAMETGPALIRALCEAVRLKVDVINMSFGEATALPNSGRFMDLAGEVVNKHGILFVSSAGNSGPALSTVGCPGGTGASIVSVAAHVSGAMMRAAYSMHGEGVGAGGPYTWTSVGPAPDGGWGVTLMAPGGAITSVPNWTLQASQLMNGTSMASPNCAGCAALLLSGLKQEGLPRTPHRVRRALENSAAPLPEGGAAKGGAEPVVQGHGMIKTADAWERLVRGAGSAVEDLRFAVTVEPSGGYGGFGGGTRRGLYLRQAAETAAATAWVVKVDPMFHEDAPNVDKIAFELVLRIECTAPWVSVPDSLTLMHGGRGFGIRVDPTSLPEGYHFCLVRGYDAAAGARACDTLFEVPITVVRPRAPPSPPLSASAAVPMSLDLPSTLAPGQMVRNFLTPPAGCTWLDITVRDTRASLPTAAAAGGQEESAAGVAPGPEGAAATDGTRRLMVVHVLQLLPHTPFRDVEKVSYLQLHPGQTEVVSARVEGSATVEVVVGQYWSASGAGGVEASVAFRGVMPTPSAICLHGGTKQNKVQLWSSVTLEKVEPAAALTHWINKIAPSSAVVSPLGDRDILPGGAQMYQLVLEYPFSQTEAGEVTPRLPALNGFLYESAFHGQFSMIFDENKRLLGCGDAWPHGVKCGKGEHIVRVQVRHDSAETLKQLQGMPLHLERSLKNGSSKGISLSCYATMMDRWNSGKTFPTVFLPAGTGTACFVAEPPHDKLPKGVKPGDSFGGSVTFVKNESSIPGEGKRPGGFPLLYVAGPPPPPAPKEKEKEAPDTRTEEEKLKEAVRDLTVTRLEGLGTSDNAAFQAMFDAAIAEYPGHLPLLQALLHARDAEKSRRSRLPEVVAAADAVIAAVDQDELARHFGTNTDPDDLQQAKLRKEMQKHKDALGDALARKARALADMEDEKAMEAPAAPADGSGSGGDAEAPASADAAAEPMAAEVASSGFLTAYAELQKWEDVSQDKHSRVQLAYLLRKSRRGSALKLLGKLLGQGAACKVISRAELLELRAKMFAELGWQHLVENDKAWRVLSSPKAYPLF